MQFVTLILTGQDFEKDGYTGYHEIMKFLEWQNWEWSCDLCQTAEINTEMAKTFAYITFLSIIGANPKN